MPLPFALDHINLWLLEGDTGWTLIDTGLGNDATRGHWQQVFSSALKDKPVEQIVVTHFHPDHVGCAAWLSNEWGVPVSMPQSEFLTAHAIAAQHGAFSVEAMIALFARHGLSPEHQAAFRARGNAYAKGAPELPHTHQRILPNDTLKLGAKRWRVLTGYGHSPEHASLYCDEANLLISGDMLLPRISTNVSVSPACPQANPLKWYLDSLTAYLSLPDHTLVLPSHGLPFVGIASRVEALRAHHAARCEEIVAACHSGQTVAQWLPLLFKRDLDLHQLMFAMGEALAHANFLLHDGRIAGTPGDDGIIRYTTRRD
jgi:glyoxylase-like metal-dependent hydrolase (beta-lactamase superfamily II)